MRDRLTIALVAGLAIVALQFMLVQTAYAQSPSPFVLIVKSSPDSGMETRLSILDASLLPEAIKNSSVQTSSYIPVTDAYLSIHENGSIVTYLLDPLGYLYRQDRNEMVVLSGKHRTKLLRYVHDLRKVHYGKLVRWEEARKVVGRRTIFKIVDLETGLAFRAQRRAGSNHADAQPLTKADAATMKQIYNGRWSWNRRAIVVQLKDHLLAASMNGMPHGGDGIPHNGFSGHFCIHFLGSTTHRSKHADLFHQLMEYKASGNMDAYLAAASPNEIVDTFFAAMDMNEAQLLRKLLGRADHPASAYFLDREARFIRINRISHLRAQVPSEPLAEDTTVSVQVVGADGAKERRTLTFRLRRLSLYEPWRIESIVLDDPRPITDP